MYREESVDRRKEKEFLLGHFKTRCLERVGEVISQEYMHEQLANGKMFSVKYCVEENRTSYILTYKNKFYVVVYDLDYNVFVTIYKNNDRTCLLGKKYVITRR